MYIYILLFGAFCLWLLAPFIFFQDYLFGQTKLRTARKGQSHSVSYFIAGLLAQPEPAFRFLLDHPMLVDDTLVFADYSNFGVYFDDLFVTIEQDIIRHGYKEVKIFAISLGCAITHDFNLATLLSRHISHGYTSYFTEDIPSLSCYEINPCWTSSFLRPGLRGPLPRVGLAILIAIDFLAGPLKFLPIIRNGGQSFSLHLLTGQLQRILQKFPLSPVNQGKSRTKLVVLSENDELLDNEMIAQFYAGVPIITIPGAAHARTGTDAAGKAYAQAFN